MNTPPPELTLRSLRVFVALEETGSVAAAAARIGGSPSGVSQHITTLEAAVGARLFDRTARPVTLTPAGQRLRDHAHRILGAVSQAETDLAELNLSSLPQLNLAIIDDLDASLTPVLVASLQARYARCFVNAFSGGSDQILHRLAAREADIGVTALLPADPAFRALPILREPFVVIRARNAPTNDPPYVAYSEAIPIGQTIAAHLRRVRLAPPRRFAFEATRSVMAMVVQTGGWAITTPLNLLDAERFLPDLTVHPLPFAALSRRIHLVARADELGHLPDHLASECRQMIRTRLVPRFEALAPDMAGMIEVES
ncbi:MAG: LysR family transcriptional regulator [Pseudomonadota bacterium]